MQDFKIQHFKSTHPNTPFPWYRSLSQLDAASVRMKISKALNLNSQDPDILISAIEEKGTLVEGEKASNSHFEIAKLLSNFGIQPRQNVLINWSRYDDIDEIGLGDLNMYFSDIWYPGPDDIDIFDSSFRWFLSISPEGYVKVMRTTASDSAS